MLSLILCPLIQALLKEIAADVLIYLCESESISDSVVSNSLRAHATCQAPLSMGLSRQEYWRGLPFPSPGDLLNSGTEPRSPAMQADSLPLEPCDRNQIQTD